MTIDHRQDAIIVINPGSTSTKFALWGREGCIDELTVRHYRMQLAPKVVDQFDYRRALIDAEFEPLLPKVNILGVVGRGGPLKPLKGGAYLVNRAMLDDLRSGRYSNHASNLGAILADHYARRFGVKAYVVDPVTVDEFWDLSRLSGVPWIERKSRSHALNLKAVARRAAEELGKPLDDTRFVAAHLGGGTSIAAMAGGRIVDVNDALLGMGPFSPERAGALPIGPLIERCFDGKTTQKELLDELARKGGLMAYCGTSDVREILQRVHNGDPDAGLALRTMIYQDAKEIGALAAALEGRLDAVIITGGLAHSEEIVGILKPYVEFLGRVMVFPGEGELEALAAGAWRVIEDAEAAMEYL